MDTSTDLLILIIPITIVWQVRVAWKQEVVLLSLFGLVLVTVAVTVSRGIVSLHYSPPHNKGYMIWLLVWSYIECSICQCLVLGWLLGTDEAVAITLFVSGRSDLCSFAKERHIDAENKSSLSQTQGNR
jgi:hypothetical protein